MYRETYFFITARNDRKKSVPEIVQQANRKLDRKQTIVARWCVLADDQKLLTSHRFRNIAIVFHVLYLQKLL